jgi:lincosamide nucleotidyltransferase A/C/D/E
MRHDHVIQVLDGLDRAGVRYWIGGGWGVVALTGRQTREHGRQAGPDGTHFDYPPSALSSGEIAGRRVSCLSAARQRHFRTGYELRPQDVHDLAELDAVR